MLLWAELASIRLRPWNRFYWRTRVVTFTPSFAALVCWQAAAAICGHDGNPHMNEKRITGHWTDLIKPRFSGQLVKHNDTVSQPGSYLRRSCCAWPRQSFSSAHRTTWGARTRCCRWCRRCRRPVRRPRPSTVGTCTCCECIGHPRHRQCRHTFLHLSIKRR